MTKIKNIAETKVTECWEDDGWYFISLPMCTVHFPMESGLLEELTDLLEQVKQKLKK